VDETSQDTQGTLFLLAVVVVGDERDILLRWLETVEYETGKHLRSWHKSSHRVRLAYIDRITESPRFCDAIFYAVYHETRAYRDLTLLTIAKALGTRMGSRRYRATVVIDGLQRGEVRAVAVGLRRLRVKVRGARDESNALVRLADAMAGFLRTAEEGDAEWRERLGRAVARGIICRV
jgi:hypothetical protein